MEHPFYMQTLKTIKESKKKEFHTILDELQPYDVAELFQEIPEKYHMRFLLFLSPKQLAELIQELDKETQWYVLHKLGAEKSGKVMDLMQNDDVVTLLEDFSIDEIEAFLKGMKKEESEIVQTLMNYPSESAGRLMTDRFVWIRDFHSVKETVNKLKTYATYTETINYLYVVDHEKKLVGVVSYRDLLLADEKEKIKDIMYHRVISVSVYTDQEEVAQIIEKYDFLAVPVVEEDGVLMGIVTVDDILDVVIQEANEDIEKLSASGKDIDFETSSWTAAFRRLPWLILLLFIGILSGTIISRFEHILLQVVALSFFMPMISGMTGNTGTQSLAIVVRGLISNSMNWKKTLRLILREFVVGLFIGIVCGGLIAIIAYFWQGSWMLGLVVGLSLLITLIIGTLAGTIIPLILHKLKIDPAVASGPFITTINDILSLLIYFGLATFFLNYL